MFQWLRSLTSTYFDRKIITVFFLGIVSGLPLALVFSTLSVWLAEEGISRTTIGMFALVSAPYTFKFIWSPLMDQVKLPLFGKLGKRCGWLIFIQLCLMAGIFAMGYSNPSVNVTFMAIMAFLVSFASASQDIVIDAYRVEILDDEQQGAGAAVITLGYRVGMVISGGGALFLAHYLGWFVCYALMSACVIIGIVTVIISGEPKKTKDFVLTSGFLEGLEHAVVQPFKDFIKRPGWFIILLFIALYKCGDAFAGVMTNTFLIEMGFSKIEIAEIVKIYGLFAILAGVFIGGSMVPKLGNIKSLFICGILQMLSNLFFILQAKVGHDIGLLAFVIGFENLASGMGTAVFVAYVSRLCNLEYTATQYALFSSLAALGRTFFSASSGWFVDHIGWENFFLLSTIIALPGILLLFKLKKASGFVK